MLYRIAVFAAVIFAGIVAADYVGSTVITRATALPSAAPSDLDESKLKLRHEIPGVRRPKVYNADEVNLPDEVEVLGVQVGDEFRAYVLPVLSVVESHVVNDLIADAPISVTYCEFSDCARVLTSSIPGYPIDLGVGGLDEKDQLVLLFQGQRYRQKSQLLPLIDYPFTRTTWADWKSSHPLTSVYIGLALHRGHAIRKGA